MRLTVRSGVSVPGLTVRELAHGMEVTEQKEGRSPAHHVLLCKIARGAGQGKKPLGLIPTGLYAILVIDYLQAHFYCIETAVVYHLYVTFSPPNSRLCSVQPCQ